MDVNEDRMFEKAWSDLYQDLIKHKSKTLVNIAQMTIASLEEINRERDSRGRLSEVNELAYQDYHLHLNVINCILLERGISR